MDPISENDNELEQDQDAAEPASLRDDLEAAFEAVEGSGDAPDPDAAGDRESPVSDPEGRTEPATDEGADRGGERPRDDKGRFAPKQAAAEQQAPATDLGAAAAGARAAAGPGASEPPPAAPVERAPQSWRPQAREHWGQLPADVRQEVMRREQEVARTLNETATARKEAEAYRSAVAPFEGLIRSEGSNPLKAITTLLTTAQALRTAPPGYKAQMVAQMVRTYGVPIQALDAALAGQMPPPQAQAAMQPQAFRDPRLDQLLAQMEERKRVSEERATQQAVSQVETFGSNREFFEDVREEMADILELAQRRGREVSLDDAYQQAIRLHPEISKIVQQREAAARVRTPGATARARNAASSVKSSPAKVVAGSRGASVRDDLEAAFEELTGR